MKTKKNNVIRWVFFIPAAIIMYIIAFAFIKIIILAMNLFVNPESYFEILLRKYICPIGGTTFASVMFIFSGTICAPSNKKTIAIILSLVILILFLFSISMGIYLNKSESIYESFGHLIGCIVLFIKIKENDQLLLKEHEKIIIKNKNTLSMFLIIIFSCSLSSCITEIKIQPISCDKFKDCKETIKKVYSQQTGTRSPNELEITNEYISYSKQRVKTNRGIAYSYGSATITDKKTIYYNNIGSVMIMQKHSRYEIRIWNKSNKLSDRIFLDNKDLAIQGYSAIKCMIDKSLKENNLF